MQAGHTILVLHTGGYGFIMISGMPSMRLIVISSCFLVTPYFAHSGNNTSREDLIVAIDKIEYALNFSLLCAINGIFGHVSQEKYNEFISDIGALQELLYESHADIIDSKYSNKDSFFNIISYESSEEFYNLNRLRAGIECSQNMNIVYGFLLVKEIVGLNVFE